MDILPQYGREHPIIVTIIPEFLDFSHLVDMGYDFSSGKAPNKNIKFYFTFILEIKPSCKRGICAPMFTPALLMSIVKEKGNSASSGDWIKKIHCTYIVEHYSAFNKKYYLL